MSPMNSKKIAMALTVAGLAGLITGCGGANSTGFLVPPANPAGAYNNGMLCSVNLIPTAGQPQITGIGFNATGITWKSNTIVGGSVPIADNSSGNGVYLNQGGVIAGTVTITGPSPTGVGQYVGSGPDGNFYFNPQMPAQSNIGMTNYGTPINASGTVMISSQKLSTIPGYGQLYQPTAMPIGSMPMATLPTSQLCVNGAAFSLSVTTDGTNKIYGGRVYLYLSQPTQAGGYPTSAYMGASLSYSGHGTYLQF